MVDSTHGKIRAAVIAAVLLVGAVSTGCSIPGTPIPAAPSPSIPAPDTPPPKTPPWTLAELVHYPCTVLGPEDLARFGFDSPETPGQLESFCQWSTLDTTAVQVDMFFVPDPWHTYPRLEEEYRGEEYFRTLRIEGRTTFLIDQRNYGGYRNCRIWIAAPSGGAIHFEYAPRDAGVQWDVCAPAIDIVTVIAQRVT